MTEAETERREKRERKRERARKEERKEERREKREEKREKRKERRDAQYSSHIRSTRLMCAVLVSHACAPLPHINLITLGLPVVDAAGTQITVTMSADGALAAFGEFALEHAGPEFFSTVPRFTCTPSGRLLAVKIIRSTCCERAHTERKNYSS